MVARPAVHILACPLVGPLDDLDNLDELHGGADLVLVLEQGHVQLRKEHRHLGPDGHQVGSEQQ